MRLLSSGFIQRFYLWVHRLSTLQLRGGSGVSSTDPKLWSFKHGIVPINVVSCICGSEVSALQVSHLAVKALGAMALVQKAQNLHFAPLAQVSVSQLSLVLVVFLGPVPQFLILEFFNAESNPQISQLVALNLG